MVIQFDKGLLNLFFRHPNQPPHQDHEREQDLCHDSPQLMGEEDIFTPQNREDEKQSPGQHKKDQSGEGHTEDKRKRRVNVLQPHDGNIPEKKDKEKENQTGKHQKPYEDSLFRLMVQSDPPVQNAEFEVRSLLKIFHSAIRIPNSEFVSGRLFPQRWDVRRGIPGRSSFSFLPIGLL